MHRLALATALLAPAALLAQGPSAPTDAAVAAVMPKVVEWRRDIHRHPELSNRETRTGAMVAEHLKRLGMEVRTGVVGVL